MKFLFKIIVIPILSILAIPAIFLALTYRDVEIPVDDFQNVEAVNLTDMITEQMDVFLSTGDSTATLGLGFTQQEANGLLKNAFLAQNVNYLSESATDDQKNYVMKEDMYGFQGSWVRFKEDTVEIESGIHVFVAGFTYKTVVLITFNMTVDTEEVVLTLDKLNIGSLPLAWTFNVASWAAEQITGKDIQTIIDDQLNGMAEFDPDKREIRLDIQTLIDNQFSSDPQSAALVNSLLAFISSNDLLDIGFSDGVFTASLKLGKMRDDTAPFVLDPALKIADQDELKAILQAKASSLILSTLTTTDYPYIELKALTLNRMFEFFMRDSLIADGIVHQVEMFEQYRMTAYVPYFTIVTDPLDANVTDFTVNIPMLIEDMTDPLKNFPTIIKISATPEIDGSDLKIVLNELNAGEVTLSEEHIANILTLLGSSDILVGGAFVISDFAGTMDQAGLGLQSVEPLDNKLRLYVELDLDSETSLEDVQTAVTTVIDTVGNNSYNTDLDAAIDNLIGSLDDPTTLDPQVALDALINEIDDLTDAEQAVIYQDLLDAFDGTGLTFDDIAGLDIPTTP